MCKVFSFWVNCVVCLCSVGVSLDIKFVVCVVLVVLLGEVIKVGGVCDLMCWIVVRILINIFWFLLRCCRIDVFLVLS